MARRTLCFCLILALGLAQAAPCLAREGEPLGRRAARPGEDLDAFRLVPTRPGVAVPVSLLLPAKPLGAVILLAGGNGVLGIADDGGRARLRRQGNFLVFSRYLFAERGLAVAVADVPTDHAVAGLDPLLRFSAAHLEDLRALAVYVRKATGHRPWLVGTSMGTLSAAWGAEHLGADPEGDIAGVVLTSTVTRTGRRWGLSGRYDRAALNPGLVAVRVPALVTAHRADTCWATPPGDAPDLLELLANSPRRELLLFEGGPPRRSEPCEAMSPHGYYGQEEQAVEAMVRFILAPR